MKRRTLLGTAAGAVGGASIIGSGAFNIARVDRDFTVNIVGDDDAYLRIGACQDDTRNEDYLVGGDTGQVGIQLTGDNDQVEGGGEGVNNEGVTEFYNVFEICNQGTNGVCMDFQASPKEIPSDADIPDRYEGEFGPGDPAVVFYEGDKANDPDARIDVEELDADQPGAFHLEPGDCQCIGFTVRAFGFDEGEDLFEDTDLEIVAVADAACADSLETCSVLSAEHKCSIESGENIIASRFTVEETFEEEDTLFTAFVFNAPDESEAFDEVVQGGQTDVSGAPPIPLSGLVWWESPSECGDELGLTTAEEWSGFESRTDISAETLADLVPGEYDDPEDAQERLDEIDGVEGIDDLPDITTLDGVEEIPSDAFVTEIDYTDYDPEDPVVCDDS